MLDSNGPLPFLQEGILQNTVPVDLCDMDGIKDLLGSICATAPRGSTVVKLPYGYGSAPGAEGQCKGLAGAQYCHNYFSLNVDFPSTSSDWTLPATQSAKNLNMEMTQLNYTNVFHGVKFNQGTEPRDPGDFCSKPANLDLETLEKLSDVILERNLYFKTLYTAIAKLINEFEDDLETTTKIPTSTTTPKPTPELTPGIIASLLVGAWWGIQMAGGGTGAGMWILLPQLPYQGMCYPSACSAEDIHINNVEFAKQTFGTEMYGSFIHSSPLIPDVTAGAIANGYQLESLIPVIKGSAVGCSNDDKHSGEWNSDNVTAVVVFSIVGFLIITGTIVEAVDQHTQVIGKSSDGVLVKILKAFSLISNMEFIFKHVDKRGSGRLDCLEGMRAISMTWVILGHHFLFGASFLHVRNKVDIGEIMRGEENWLLEPLKQGQFSVDTFLFIGATLLSYLLLKDLDKSNGWFHGRGVIRMILFYVNRYLRLTIPYAFVLLVFIGLLPLIITDPIASAALAQNEASLCKEFAWKHLLYINIYDQGYDNCLGQTWYLSFDMVAFILSPIVVYPLWRTRISRVNQVIGLGWWTLLMTLSFTATALMVYDGENPVMKQLVKSPMPNWNFSPLGYRNQCYLFGLLMGFILHSTKNKKIELSRLANLIIWCLVAILAICLIYGPHSMSEDETKVYYVFHKFCWGIVLSWVTFACIKGYGGVVNDLLSWGLWIPISRISFMTYLFHMSLNFSYFAAQGYNLDYSLWLMTELFVPQLFVCLFVGLMATLTLELPFGKIQKILIELLIGKK